MRILRTLILVAGIGLLLPAPPDTAARQAQGGSGLCPADSSLCETAAYVAERLQAKAAYSAALVYDWAVDATHDPGASAGRLEATVLPVGGAGTALASADPSSLAAGRSTLRLDDLIPEWRGPTGRGQKEG